LKRVLGITRVVLTSITALLPLQIVAACGVADACGTGSTVIVTSSTDGAQGGFEIVQRSTYVPSPPAGVNVAAGLAMLLN
jgi:hypothetical protein